VVLARALQTLDLVSGGRAEVGIGAGWEAGEHRSFGLAFPPMAERLERLDDACRLMTALWEDDAPVSLDGWYPLRDAQLTPRPVQARVPLLVAAASDRGIALAARWARTWCGIGSPAYLSDRIARLRREEAAAGRAPGSVETASMLRVFLSSDADAVADVKAAVANERRGGGAQARSVLPGEDPTAALYAGPPEGLAEHLAVYEEAGLQRAVLVMPRPWDPSALRRLAAAAGVGAPTV
jgi:alkanesulfonate monooxygenase SsuD/methylene tetrahydromethanopterin reductase-like flavin-dependent oxidoreductase (luciferase family)